MKNEMKSKQTKTYDGLPLIQHLVYYPQLDLVHLFILSYTELIPERIQIHHHDPLGTS